MGRARYGSGLLTPNTAAPNDPAWVKVPNGWDNNIVAGKVIVYCHGRGGDCTQAAPGQPPGAHIQALVDNGYAVVSTNTTNLLAYGHPLVETHLDEVYTYIQNVLKPAGTKIGLFAWSMGGLAVMSWLVRNAAQVAGILGWSPALDLDWIHGTGGYVPPYTSIAPSAGWAAEVNAAYGNVGAGVGTATTTATGSVTVPALGGAGVVVPLTTVLNFHQPNTKGLDTRPSQVIINGVTCTYTGVSGSTLTGVVSTTAGTVAVVNGTVVSTDYTKNCPGYDPMKRILDYNLGVPILINHASDDTTVPVGASTYFDSVCQAVSLRSPAPTGDHVGQFANVPVSETVAFFSSLAW